VTVRPTADRVREALFSILADKICGARVLDAFSGSGALGFEAASRGAASVTFLESDRAVAAGVAASIDSLGLDSRCRIVRGAAVETLRRGRVAGPFDVILADPPYDGGDGPEFVDVVASARILAPAGLLILEAAARRAAPENPGFELRRTARYGSVSLHFLVMRGAPG